MHFFPTTSFYLIVMGKHLEVKLALYLHLHPVDQVDCLVPPHLELPPVLVQVEPGYVH